ncbi:MAG: exopolysaccharide biosynthesis polyprenyl glycosylphosphotransferase [Alphaproteobacteria bacterium]|nr:exopolysaccharide biosynthesis polyprenyl glycosylphosphotransferase [Alphaproteobacteria bacterium]
MKHLRIAGKRVQTMELYLYLLSAVVTGMAFVVAVYVRQALTPFLFSAGYAPTIADGVLMIAGAMTPKMLMRVYDQKTAASRAMHLQLHVTAATLFFFGMIFLFYFQPGTRIPISIVLIFIAIDLIAAVILMPAHYFLSRAAAHGRTIAVMADDATFESLAHHRLAQTTHQATFTRLTREELPARLTDAEGEGAKAPFEQLVLDRASSAHVPDWTLLLAARDAGVVIQTPEAFLESEFGEALTDESAAYGIIMASSSNWNQLRIAVKRLFDWFVASALLLATLPLALLTGLAIWLEDRGPVFFEQLRVGMNGRAFRILKFRSMVIDAEKLGASSTEIGDPRVTVVGRFIRRTRLDEIPQLINVLKGEMSMVGPRPQTPQNVIAWSQGTPLYQLRHLVKPGVTGWAQVRFAYVATPEDARIKLAYDLYYVKNYSLILDMLVLLMTPRIILAGLGGR